MVSVNDLQNKGILVTREQKQAQIFARKIEQSGGIPYITPLLKINCVVSEDHLQTLRDLEQYEWLFFTSANGVRCFFEKWKSYFDNKRMDQKIAVVGSKTNDILKDYGYTAAFIPSVYNAETMAAEFLRKYQTQGPVLFIRGQLSRNVLIDAFTDAGLPFESLTVYETVINTESKNSLNDIVTKKNIEFITFTSPSTVDAFFALIEDVQLIKNKIIVCIGSTTEKRAKEKNLKPILVPEHFTIEGMIDRMGHYIAKKGKV